jgi:hypothetical protein
MSSLATIRHRVVRRVATSPPVIKYWTSKIINIEAGIISMIGIIYLACDVWVVTHVKKLVNLLVKRRYLLDKCATGSVSEALAADKQLLLVASKARIQFGVTDLHAFHREIEMLCLQKGKVEAPGKLAIVTYSDATVIGVVAELAKSAYSFLINAIAAIFDTVDDENPDIAAVQLLRRHVSIYEMALSTRMRARLTRDPNLAFVAGVLLLHG